MQLPKMPSQYNKNSSFLKTERKENLLEFSATKGRESTEAR